MHPCNENVFPCEGQAFPTRRARYPPLLARCARCLWDARATLLVSRVASFIGARRADLSTHLAPGRYDAFVVWAEQRDDGLAFECAITAGEHRGDVVNIVSTSNTARDAFAFVGLPCTLVADDDAIRVEFDASRDA